MCTINIFRLQPLLRSLFGTAVTGLTVPDCGITLDGATPTQSMPYNATRGMVLQSAHGRLVKVLHLQSTLPCSCPAGFHRRYTARCYKRLRLKYKLGPLV